MLDSTIQLRDAELAANGLRQVNSIKSFDGTMVSGRFLAPGQLCGLTLVPELYEHDFTYVYYISDLHLETWYEEYCKTVKAPEQPLPMSEWIEIVMNSLFSGDFLRDIDKGRSFVVFLLGDIADTFAGSELFYKAFMRRWDEIDENNRQIFERQEAERQVEQVKRHEADVRIIEEYKAPHPWTEQAKRSLILDKRVPDEVKTAIQRIEQWERGKKLDGGFVREFHPSPRNVFAVLGNHEICEFAGENELIVDDAHLDAAYKQWKQKYKDLFQSLGVHFLDVGNIPIIYNRYGTDLLITGFCGFSDPRCAPDVIGNYEIKLRDKLALWYEKWVEYAKSKGCTLVFCTHFPLLHGTVDSVCENNVYHFCGHTHKNEFEVLSETGAIIADNQVGYGWNSHKKFVFEHLGLYPRYNPFNLYEDGCHEINAENYQNFYWYCRERIKTGSIEKYLDGIGGFGKPLGDTGKLYMIKRRGYYGFFIAFDKIERVYICNGGMVNRVPDAKSIDEILFQFDAMVDACLLVFSGFRKYQEQIASYIRSFGGNGEIHGLIVDIDFFNHVGVDPVSGDVTFYYSPNFGIIQSYSDMGTLLENHAPALYPAYKQLSSISPVPYYSQDATVEGELVSVERGGKSFYGASRHMSSFQRLFSCNILRVWDENVLNKTKSAVNSLKAQGGETETLLKCGQEP